MSCLEGLSLMKVLSFKKKIVGLSLKMMMMLIIIK